MPLPIQVIETQNTDAMSSDIDYRALIRALKIIFYKYERNFGFNFYKYETYSIFGSITITVSY